MIEPAVQMHILSNGEYSVLITPRGGGCSALNGLAITRWTPAPAPDDTGFFCWIRDRESGRYWSMTESPGSDVDVAGATHHRDDMVIQEASYDGIHASCEVFVAREMNAEVRRMRLENRNTRERVLDVTTYAELSLNTPAADAGHPAFSKLFVQTAFDAQRQALVAWRRPRSPDDRRLVVAQRIVGAPAPVECETSRFVAIGRTRSAAEPRIMAQLEPLAGTTGAVLDPVFCIRVPVTLQPGASISFDVVTCAAESRERVERMLDALPPLHPASASADRAWAALGLPQRWHNAIAEAPAEYRWNTTMRMERRPPEAPRTDFGAFSKDGSEYVLEVAGGLEPTPQPWINVIANERFGCLISETGAGYTWSENSRENRVTHWSNDAVTDPPGETLVIRDPGAGHEWSVFPGSAHSARFEVRHGFGYTRFTSAAHGVEHEAVVFVPRHDPVRIVRLAITNRNAHARALTIASDAQLVLGPGAADTLGSVRISDEGNALYGTNRDRGEFSDRVAFTAAAGGTAIRRNGRFGVAVDITIPAGETRVLAFLLGEADDERAARACIDRYSRLDAVDNALETVCQFWRDLLSTVQIRTPVRAFDLMLNGWLAYQNLACRMWARSAFYQSGGAFGFRDQLQDSSALLYLDPGITRRQILLHAAHQFVEGDVLHWWHPPASKGIRTRFSDDLLWLPYITTFYVARTGDRAILEEDVRFVTAEMLEPGEDERFVYAKDAGKSATLYEHCCRAIDRSLTRGAHGLPLMGVGDWNDGMNRVGREGRGESVWLGFFLFEILHEFLPFCEARGDSERAVRYRAYVDELAVTLNDSGWDGAWYRRAYYDDGTPLGSKESDECRIDALAQAWAVLSRAAPPDRAEQAISEMRARLVDGRNGMIRLLTPSFDRTANDPGYIKGYVPGVRENGGQYTHAALWAVRAIAEMGDNENAANLLAMLTPMLHTRDAEQVRIYRGEPYVVAADVYGERPHVGRVGWTWYTGSAGWMYRVLLESILGFTIERGETIRLCPCVPSEWPGFELSYRCPDGTRFVLRVRKHAGGTATSVGKVEDGSIVIPITRDGRTHTVDIELGDDLKPVYRPRIQSMAAPLL